ncbi:hypothetical protein ACQJBY_023058 [Aegilops geniculata]
MAPTSTSWVLLKRMIFIEHDASETGGDSFIGGTNTRDAVLAYLRTLTPDACFANPPELSSLRILRPMKFTPGICGDVTSAYIASGDKNLVALFADPYRPGTNSQGGYLIYDASKNSLSTIPQPPCDYDREDVGLGAVVICLEEGAYVLVELTKDGGRPELCFIPLPGECPTFDRVQMFEQTYPLEAGEFRYIACIDGVIKFVTMDGYGERPGHEVTLTIWTLSQNLCSWKKGEVYHVRDIWKSESHISLGLPQVLPSFPVLSMEEEDVVYLFFTDMNVTEDGDTEFKSQCLIRVDMKHSKVSHHPKSADEMPIQLFSSEILASECTAYLQQGLEDHQGKLKARKVGESGKMVVL